MKRALVLLIMITFGLSCRRHGPELPIRVLYSSNLPALAKLRQAERDFSFTDPRLQSGRPFVVRPITEPDAHIEISDAKHSATFDLFILKSAADLPDVPEIRKEMGDSFSICGQAVAYIPEWANEERREGAARFLQYLSTHCR